MPQTIINIVKANARQYIGYALCAAIAVFVDLALLYVLTDFAHIWYFYSAAISFIVSVTVNFVLNRTFNFKDGSRRASAQFLIFVGISSISLTLNQTILYSLVELFGFWYMWAKLIALVIVANFSFYGHKNFTFKADVNQ